MSDKFKGERYNVITEFPEEVEKLMGDNLTGVKGPGRRQAGVAQE